MQDSEQWFIPSLGLSSDKKYGNRKEGEQHLTLTKYHHNKYDYHTHCVYFSYDHGKKVFMYAKFY